jgi:hypothetical protein
MAALEDKNLFMMCEGLNPAALTQLSAAYYVRTCRKDELDVWKAMHPRFAPLYLDIVSRHDHQATY